MSSQLPLGLHLNDHATFANFVAAAPSVLMQSVHATAQGDNGCEPFLYLWGAQDAGKSHLLQAACHLAAQQGSTVFYLPLSQHEDFSTEMLLGLELMDLVCIDDLHAIAGNTLWEQALFHLYNRVREQGGRLLVAANTAPASMGIRLPDLVSRLGWGAVFHLQPLQDAQKIRALQLRARLRGFDLPQEAGNYLLRRCPRDMGALFALLDRLDAASLVAQRRLTVPFIRQVLETTGTI